MIFINDHSPFYVKKPTPLQKLVALNKCTLYIKREDLNHPIIQGNKLRKLKYNFSHIYKNSITQIATFGGAYSNHIAATAQAAKISNIQVTGFIRGDELQSSPDKWSRTLHEANNAGMKLVFLSRQEYRLKLQSQKVKKLLSEKNNTFIIPEGGSNPLALLGVAEIIDELSKQMSPPDYILTACGTGGTCAGLIDGVAKHGWQTKVIGIPVLKGAKFLQSDIEHLSQHYKHVDWQLYFDYHAGGYAKLTDKYRKFGKKFSHETNISLDKIYNVKSFYAAYDLIEKAEIKAGSSVVIVHTGGLQGGII